MGKSLQDITEYLLANAADPNTCLIRVRLTAGVLFHDGKKYALDFTKVSK